MLASQMYRRNIIFFFILKLQFIGSGLSGILDPAILTTRCATVSGYVFKECCYYVVYDNQTWNGAMSKCAASASTNLLLNNGQLATFQSPQDMTDAINDHLLQYVDAKTNNQKTAWIGLKVFGNTTTSYASSYYWTDQQGIPISQLINASTTNVGLFNISLPTDQICAYFTNNNIKLELCDAYNENIKAFICQTGCDANYTKQLVTVKESLTTVNPANVCLELLRYYSFNNAMVISNGRPLFVVYSLNVNHRCGNGYLAHFISVDEYLNVTQTLLSKAEITEAWTGLYTWCPDTTNLDYFQWNYNFSHSYGIADASFSAVTNFTNFPTLTFVFTSKTNLYNTNNVSMYYYSICEFNCDNPTMPTFNTFQTKVTCPQSTTDVSTIKTANTPTNSIPKSMQSSTSSTLQVEKSTEDIKTTNTSPRTTTITLINPTTIVHSSTSSTLQVEKSTEDIKTTTTIANEHQYTSSDKTITERSLEVCSVGPWSNFSSCSASCGEAVLQQRTRVVTNVGRTCPLPLSETQHCDIPPCNPMSPLQEKAAKAVQTLGCAWIIGISIFSLVISIIFWSWKTTRVFHASEELCLILAHCIIAFARSETKNHKLCIWAGIGIQYFFLVHFVCLALESLHVFAVITNVVNSESFFTIRTNLLTAWGVPVIIVGFTAIFSYHEYISKFSCWLNIGKSISLGTILPIAFCTFISIVLLEATGQYHFDNVKIAEAAKEKSAKVIQRGLLFIIPINLAAWLVGVLAIYQQNLGLFTSVFALNLALGVTIGFFHLLANEKGRSLVARMLKW